jgi:hypothetical protein
VRAAQGRKSKPERLTRGIHFFAAAQLGQLCGCEVLRIDESGMVRTRGFRGSCARRAEEQGKFHAGVA